MDSPNTIRIEPRPSFTDLIDLVSERVGGKALVASDEFFASKKNLLKAESPICKPDKFTSRGKWMDGWESRRKRVSGNDWCIIRLGVPGIIRGININTAYFIGNCPQSVSVEGLTAPVPITEPNLRSNKIIWNTLLEKSAVKGGGDNYFSISDSGTLTHVRLNIYPDGGVARLRVYGEVAPDWEKICSSKGAVDLAAIEHGGRVLCCNDMFFGPKDNLILPGLAKNMGDGWETRRRRVPGHDWIVIRLGTRGAIQKIEVDTSFFKGNFPESCSIDGCIDSRRDMTADEFSNVSHDWKEILPRTKLRAHHRHLFQKELSRNVLGTGMDFIRLNIYPDGGVSRLRVYGVPLR